MNNPLHIKVRYEVFPTDVDAMEHCRLTSLERLFLNSAYAAANHFGFGASEMIERGITWVLLKFAMEVERLPLQKEEVEIETWVESANRLLTTRCFVMRDLEGNTLCSAVSEWSMLDIATRHPVNLLELSSITDVVTGDSSTVAKVRKIETVDAEPSMVRTVCYSDIDYNNHTNSMQYLQWMLDAYPMHLLLEKPVRRLEITYNHEAVYGERVEVAYHETESSVTFNVGNQEKEFAKAKIFWR